eukprot:1149562-Pelagomonas_calceolata.AAC.5
MNNNGWHFNIGKESWEKHIQQYMGVAHLERLLAILCGAPFPSGLRSGDSVQQAPQQAHSKDCARSQ